MDFKVRVWLLMTGILFTCTSGSDLNIDGWYPWTHESIDSSDLYCPNICKSIDWLLPHAYQCCFGLAVPYWSFLRNQIGLLSIEYKTRHGSAIIMDENQFHFEFYIVIHQNGFLTHFPTNICNFTLIVKINFTENKIMQLPDLYCLINLDELDLEQNHIVYIKNTTFSRLQKLRKLVLGRNHIHYLEPKSLLIQPGSLMHVDLSRNYLESIDVTNVIIEKFFHKIDYSYNKINKATNEIDWHCCAQSPAHGGFVDFSFNSLNSFFNFSDLGFNVSFPPETIVAFYGFDIRHNKWFCDCLFLPFLEKAMTFYDYFQILYDHYGGQCASPSHLTNYSLPDFRKNDNYDLLICNLSMANKCPSECFCYYQPSQNRTVVKCIRPATLDKPPNWNTMPDYDNLEMDFSNNRIDILKGSDYFKRITKLNLSNNSLNSLNFSIFDASKLTELILLDNPVTVIDKSVQNLQRCAVRIGKISIKCDCESIWLQPWLSKQRICDFQNTIICQTEDGPINAINADSKRLCTETKSVIWLYIMLFTFLAVIVAIVFIIWTKYRYELYLLYRNMPKRKRNKVNIVMRYDAYISFDGENVELRLWTAKILLRYLESKGYKIFYPLRDCNLGQPREEDICRKIDKCATFIVFLSHSYFHSRHLKLEWKYIWHSFKANPSKEIIIINFDDLCKADTEDDRINAFLRLGYTLDFFNISKTLISDIEKRIRRRPKQTTTGLENRLVKFIPPRRKDGDIMW